MGKEMSSEVHASFLDSLTSENLKSQFVFEKRVPFLSFRILKIWTKLLSASLEKSDFCGWITACISRKKRDF